jgi:hypothetical protein
LWFLHNGARSPGLNKYGRTPTQSDLTAPFEESPQQGTAQASTASAWAILTEFFGGGCRAGSVTFIEQSWLENSQRPGHDLLQQQDIAPRVFELNST